MLSRRYFASLAIVKEEVIKKSSTLMSDVHGTSHGKKAWRNKPLFRRQGDKRFRTGMEASEMLYEEVVRRDPYQVEFLQASKMLLDSLAPAFNLHPKLAFVSKNFLEAERAIQFRVPWMDDAGNNRVNRGYRVQFSSALGPYRGGLRFHKDMSHGTVKFLALDNVLRNALVGDYGGAAGGADFDPNGKSEDEVMRFCQSFMTELVNYIGPHSDIPGPGVGVGQKEIGYMYGQYKRLKQLSAAGGEGVISGGKILYREAMGYGIAHYANIVLNEQGDSVKGKRVCISGSGNTALSAAIKLTELGAKVMTLSDSSGYIVEPQAFTIEKLKTMQKIKADRNAKIGAYVMTSTTAQYHPKDDGDVWDNECDIALPCSVQNEIGENQASKLAKNGCMMLCEGTAMPCNEAAVNALKRTKISVLPWKIASSASFTFLDTTDGSFTGDQIDAAIVPALKDIHLQVKHTASRFDAGDDLVSSANIAAFLKVADATLRQGAV